MIRRLLALSVLASLPASAAPTSHDDVISAVETCMRGGSLSKAPAWAGPRKAVHLQDHAQLLAGGRLVVQPVVDLHAVKPGGEQPSGTSDGLGVRATLQVFVLGPGGDRWRALGEIAAAGDVTPAAWPWKAGLIVAPLTAANKGALCDGKRWHTITVPDRMGGEPWLAVNDGENLVVSGHGSARASCPNSGPLRLRPTVELLASTVDSEDASFIVYDGKGGGVQPPADAACFTASDLRAVIDGKRALVAWTWCKTVWAGDSAAIGPCRLGAALFNGDKWAKLPGIDGPLDAQQGLDYRLALHGDTAYLALPDKGSGRGARATLYSLKLGGGAWERGETFPPGGVEELGVLPDGGLGAVVVKLHDSDGQIADLETQLHVLGDAWKPRGHAYRYKGGEPLAAPLLGADGSLVLRRIDWGNARLTLLHEDASGWKPVPALDLPALLGVPAR